MLKGLALLVTALLFTAQNPALGQDGKKDAAELRLRGLAYSRGGQISRAIDAYQSAIAADPSIETAYLELTDILLVAGVPDDASSILKRARRMFPRSKLPEYNTLYYRLGIVYIGAGRPGQAAEAMTEAADARGEVPPDTIYKKLGDLRVDLIQYNEAEAAYKKALNLNPDNLSAHLALGSLDVRRNRLKDSLAEYQRVVSAAPTNVAALAGIAEVYFRLGRFTDAASEAAHAIALDPTHRPARYVRGQALLRLGRPDEGRSELQIYQSLEREAEASSLKSGDIYSLYTGGTARLAKGDYAGAISLFRRGIGAYPDERRFYLALGAALGQSGSHQDAVATYAKAIERFGDDPKLRQDYDREAEAVRNLHLHPSP